MPFKITLELNLDTTYLCALESKGLPEHERFPGCINDVGQEGYPTILNDLNYFLVDKWMISTAVELRLIFAETPKNARQNEVYKYRALYLVSYATDGTPIDTKLVGKHMIQANNGEDYQTVFSTVKDEKLIVASYEKWRAANGSLHTSYTSEHFTIRTNGVFADIHQP